MQSVIQGPAKPHANNFIFPDSARLPAQKRLNVFYVMGLLLVFLKNVTKHSERASVTHAEGICSTLKITVLTLGAEN